MHVGGHKNLGYAGDQPLWEGGVADYLETRYSRTCVILPDYFALGQTVWYGGPKIVGDTRAPPFWDGAWLTPLKHAPLHV